ncbi:ABC transporter permease [Streptomyces sp. NPDC050560]|uniref:ABC transporter permease n=1 Tax=Streptomyces sp. NPDC050560 TaxID=3365630 RepID=UPI0037B70029
MNFAMRAGMSLGARKSRTAGLLGVFFALCTLLLGGFLLQDAAARQEADARRTVGVDVTVRKKDLTPSDADRLGDFGPVLRYSPELQVRAAAHGLEPLAPGGGAGHGAREPKPLSVHGIRDQGMLLSFSYGSTKITEGRGIAPGDAGHRVVVVEQSLAGRNRLRVGDTVRMVSGDGGHEVPLKVVGIFRDPRQDPSASQAPHELPGNTLYVPVGTAQRLAANAAPVSEAGYRIGSPEQAEELYARAQDLLGRGTFDFRVNDKAYRDQVRPIQRVGTFAGLVIWVIALAGALILGLVVTLQIRERRTELGVLLSLGERKWKLIGQHVVEVAAVAVPAVALAALAGALGGQSAGDAFLGHRADEPPAAHHAQDAGVAPPRVRVEAATVGKVGGIGLGISLVATVVPGVGILRLHPRSILTDGE